MISEGSCDTEDWSNDAENSALITEINYILLYIQIKKTVLLNHSDISKYYSFYCSFFFFLINILFLFFHTQHNIISKIQQNKTKQQTHTQHLKVQSKGRERGKDNKNTKVTPLYNHVYSTKNTAKHQWLKAWPHRLAPLYTHMTLFAGGYGSNMFLHMCGVNQFWIIVFFTAVKPANNILFCIELIQRPESSLRRHKLGLTDQSILSNDDKSFYCSFNQINDMYK